MRKKLTTNEEKYSIKCVIDKVLRKELLLPSCRDYKICVVKNSGNQSIFKGFHYFNPNHLFERDNIFTSEDLLDKPINFLVAYENENQRPEEITGVLKFGIYNCMGGLPDYWAINYVDVREDKRRQGICTSLFKKLNQVLTCDDWLCGTPLSDMGEKCRLDKKLHEIITVCPYFDDKNKFWEYCRENEILIKKERK